MAWKSKKIREVLCISILWDFNIQIIIIIIFPASLSASAESGAFTGAKTAFFQHNLLRLASGVTRTNIYMCHN